MSLYKYIGDSIGLPALLEQTAEEAAELAHAALKLSRVIREENPTPVTWETATGNLREEITDVSLCMSALEPFVGVVDGAIYGAKLQRWLDRIGRRDT